MRVKLTQDIADCSRGFFMLGLRRQAEFAHGIDDSPLDRLQAVADVWKGAVKNDVHRIIKVRLLCVGFEWKPFEDFSGFKRQWRTLRVVGKTKRYRWNRS